MMSSRKAREKEREGFLKSPSLVAFVASKNKGFLLGSLCLAPAPPDDLVLSLIAHSVKNFQSGVFEEACLIVLANKNISQLSSLMSAYSQAFRGDTPYFYRKLGELAARNLDPEDLKSLLEKSSQDFLQGAIVGAPKSSLGKNFSVIYDVAGKDALDAWSFLFGDLSNFPLSLKKCRAFLSVCKNSPLHKQKALDSLMRFYAQRVWRDDHKQNQKIAWRILKENMTASNFEKLLGFFDEKGTLVPLPVYYAAQNFLSMKVLEDLKKLHLQHPPSNTFQSQEAHRWDEEKRVLINLEKKLLIKNIAKNFDETPKKARLKM